MSNDINNFLETMVQAKAAIEAQPGLHKRIAELERHTHIQGETIANRELHIHNLKGTVTELTQKLRSVEAERDDAGFRTLEAEDKVQGLLTRLNRIVTDSLETIAAVSGGTALVVVPEADRQELAQRRAEAVHHEHELELGRNALTEAEAHAREYFDKLGESEQRAMRLQAELNEAKRDQYRPFVEQPSPAGTMGYGTTTSTISHETPIDPIDESGHSAGFSVEPDPMMTLTTQSGPSTATQDSTTNTPTATAAIERDTASTMGQSEVDPSAVGPQSSGGSALVSPATTTSNASAAHGEGVSVSADPTQTGPTGPLPVSQSETQTSSGTEASQEYTLQMEAKRRSDNEAFHTKLGPHPEPEDDFWPIPSRASHHS